MNGRKLVGRKILGNGQRLSRSIKFFLVKFEWDQYEESGKGEKGVGISV
jgi:hypothetical protein